MANVKGDVTRYNITLMIDGLPIALTVASGGTLSGGHTNNAWHAGAKLVSGAFDETTCDVSVLAQDDIQNLLKKCYLREADTGIAIHTSYVNENEKVTYKYGSFVVKNYSIANITEFGGGSAVYVDISLGFNDLIE